MFQIKFLLKIRLWFESNCWVDESSFYMDAPGYYALESKGRKRVCATTTGKEKTRLLCLMTGTAAGK